MKKLNLVLLIAILFPVILNAQCNKELIKLGMKDINGAQFLKEFPVKLNKGKRGKMPPQAIYTVMLKKGNQYRLNIKNDSLNKTFAILQLADDYSVYGSTYNPNENIRKDTFDFFCNKSGTYYLTIKFKDKKEGCAVGIISKVKEFNAYKM
ncbi:MAG: hypothetical protein GXO79_01565 [Chlorobi bacterium]|nr:hypothetical protein [Chlorobiota bacterium]